MRNINIVIAISFLFSVSSASLAPGAYSFSNLLSGSDLVIEGTVLNVQTSPGEYRISLRIEECLMGACDEEEIAILVPMAEGEFYLDDEPYLEPNSRPILFLHPDRGRWAITNSIAGVMRLEAKSGIKEVIRQYHSLPQLFSQNHTAALIDVFNSVDNPEIKTRLLYDLENMVTDQDAPFIASLIASEDKDYLAFGILQAGKNHIESLRPDIEALLESCKDSEILFHAIVSLGYYGNVENLPIIFKYLNHPEQGIRRVAIEAAGRMESESIVSPLQDWYPNETDWGNRVAIIEAICRISNKELVLNALNGFKTLESHDFILQFLDGRIGTLN